MMKKDEAVKTIKTICLSEEIINYAQTNHVDLIFAGRRGISKIKQMLIGSTTSRLARN